MYRAEGIRANKACVVTKELRYRDGFGGRREGSKVQAFRLREAGVCGTIKAVMAPLCGPTRTHARRAVHELLKRLGFMLETSTESELSILALQYRSSTSSSPDQHHSITSLESAICLLTGAPCVSCSYRISHELPPSNKHAITHSQDPTNFPNAQVFHHR